MNLSRRLRVALLVESSIAYGREIQKGVADYLQCHGLWSVFIEQRELGAQPPDWLTRVKWDGIITRVTNSGLAQAIERLKIFAVNLNDRIAGVGIPSVRSDDYQIGRMAAQHLIEQGFQSFAFCGFSGEDWSEKRRMGFSDCVAEAGFRCSCYESHWDGPNALPWDVDEERIATWLRRLPRPLGVGACNDVRGHHVLEACRRAEISVPQEAGVIGVDNEVQLCRLCNPPLSSVVPNAYRVGYLAAQLLDRLIQGEPAPDEPILVSPSKVVSRLSTDVLAIRDTDVVSAVRFIREHACDGIHVEDILKHVHVSRSLLERKFRELIGKTPHEVIRQTQLRRARDLLEETDLPLKQIAALSGFSRMEYLSYYFKRVTGLTPGTYRKNYKRSNC